jgi:hypothetical protein
VKLDDTSLGGAQFGLERRRRDGRAVLIEEDQPEAAPVGAAVVAPFLLISSWL